MDAEPEDRKTHLLINSMQTQLNQVAEFHRRIGETVSDSPTLLEHDADVDNRLADMLRQTINTFRLESDSGSHLTRRVLMAVEELAEWIEAHVASDCVAAADAWADRMYLLLGDAVATGMPAEPLLNEVHRSNMSKLATSDHTGKGIKPATFSPPRLQSILDSATIRQTPTDNLPPAGTHD